MANLQTTTVTGFTNVCQSTASPSVAGRLWYDNSSCSLKYSYCGESTTWSVCTGSPVSKAAGGAAGNETNFIITGGFPGGGGNYTFNGTTWTSIANLPENRAYHAMSGVGNAAVSMGGCWFGYGCVSTSEWDGSSWSGTGNQPVARACAGRATCSQNSTINYGGYNPTTAQSFCSTSEYNGNTWGTGGNLPLCIRDIGNMGAGTQNSAVHAGGCRNSPNTAICTTYEYNGSSWSTTNNLNCTRSRGVGGGTQNLAVLTGGLNSPQNNKISTTELYNGNTWSFVNCPPISHMGAQAGGTGASGIAHGGFGSPSGLCSNANAFCNASGLQACELL
jgi:hypothetical protein